MRLRAKSRQLIAALLLVVVLGISLAPSVVFAADRDDQVSYNTEYIFPLTRGLNDLDIHPGLKVTLVPATLILDLAFLPFGLVMGFFPDNGPHGYDRR